MITRSAIVALLLAGFAVAAAPGRSALAVAPPQCYDLRTGFVVTAMQWLTAPGTLVGTPGDDLLAGSTGNDVIKGSGDDEVRNFGGTPNIDCGSGSDAVAPGASTSVRRCETTIAAIAATDQPDFAAEITFTNT